MQNRRLEIKVVFNVTDTGDGNFGGSAVYSHESSDPPMENVLSSDGSIDLSEADTFGTSKYNQNVDLIFFLESPCSGDESFDVEWATQYGQGMSIEVPDGGSSGEMEVVTARELPQVIEIKDKDDDSNTYNYKPAVELVRPGHDRYYISLDPQIVNRPRN